MNDITIEDVINSFRKYNDNESEIEKIKKSYEFAKYLHEGQYRQSGEPYIIHPLHVAYILSEMYADSDMICAGFLHDTLEDTNFTKNDVIREFNPQIANLVDGVTKISKLNFTSQEEMKLANARKIITSLTNDVRIIIIKLADRLHNMRTIEYKSLEKQRENAEETLEIFVPLSYYIGAYRIKSELEDISFRVLEPQKYYKILDDKLKLENNNITLLSEMSYKIKRILENKEIPNEIKIRTKNIYGIFKKMNDGYKLSTIHDLLALKIMVDDIDNCYRTIGIIHSLYNPFNSRFKDYICSPKTNNYQSLHTTLFAPGDRLVQTQVRTFNMDKVASFGLTAYWNINKGNVREANQELLKNKFQFLKPLKNIDDMYSSDSEFFEQIKSELFSKQIYVYNSDGTKMELPYGSTLIDYAYRLGKVEGDSLVYGIVNDKAVTPEYMLQNNDRIILLTEGYLMTPKDTWDKFVKTSYAKRMLTKSE